MKISDEQLDALAASELANDTARSMARELLVARRVAEAYEKLQPYLETHGFERSRTLAAYYAVVNQPPKG